MSSLRFILLIILSIFCALPCLATPATPLPTACRQAVMQLPNDQSRSFTNRETKNCYRLDLPTAGLLLIGIQELRHNTAAPRLELFTTNGSGNSLITLERSLAEQIVWSAATPIFVLVSSHDHRLSLPDYRLTSSFVEVDREQLFSALKSETDGEIEVDPETAPTIAWKSETDGEIEVDPETGPTPELDAMTVFRFRLCSATTTLGTTDQHGDALSCATALEHRASGELSNDWADDQDVFRIDLESWSNVELTAAADQPIRVQLLDRHGYQLADTPSNDHHRLLRHLAPGSYFIRILGTDGSKFRLSIR